MNFIKGMGKHNDQFIIILDIDKVFSVVDVVMMQESEMALAGNG